MPAVVRFDPFRDITTLREEMNRLFSRTIGDGGSSSGSAWTPAVDIFDTNEAVVLKAELPGLSAGGHRHRDRRQRPHPEGRATVRGGGGGGALLPPGAGLRALPAQRDPAPGVKADEISANFDDGVLTVRIPKADEVKPRKIAVGAGAGATAA